MKELKAKSDFDPADGIKPPLLILITGISGTGKSTLAKL